MANSTRAQLGTKVKANCAGNASASFATAVDAGLDAACEEITEAAEWKELQSRTTALSTRALAGAWVAGTAFAVGQVVLDGVGSTGYWVCAVVHTSGSGTFAQDRVSHATYWTATTLDATAQVTLPTDCRSVQRVDVLDGTMSYNVPLRTKDWVESYYPAADQFSAGAWPAWCDAEGSTLFFAPVSSEIKQLRVHYAAKLTLSAGTSAEVSCDGFDSLLVAYATAWAAESSEHGEKTAARWWSVYGRRVRSKLRAQGSDGTLKGVDTRCSPRGAKPLGVVRDATGAVVATEVRW